MCEIQNELSACYNNPCRNGGRCELQGFLDNYTCQCPIGYQGRSRDLVTSHFILNCSLMKRTGVEMQFVDELIL